MQADLLFELNSTNLRKADTKEYAQEVSSAVCRQTSSLPSLEGLEEAIPPDALLEGTPLPAVTDSSHSRSGGS